MTTARHTGSATAASDTVPVPSASPDLPVRYWVEEGVARIELNRAEALNALSPDMGVGLLAALRAAAAEPAARVLLISGQGRAFCAGADMKDDTRGVMPNGEPNLTNRLRDVYNPAVLEIRAMPIPVIAAVQGACAGVASALVLACDMVIAAESAYLLLAFIRLGLMPEAGSLWFLTERIGLARTTALAMLGDRLPARTALEWGLFNEVCAEDELMPTARALAERLAQGPGTAYGNIKRTLNELAQTGLAEHLGREVARQQEHARDFVEGRAAFIEKRPPVFQAR